VKRLIISTFLAGLAMTAPAATASAQDFNPFEIGGAAGVAIPTGDLGDATDLGYNATFFVGYNPRFLPMGLRFEAAYNEFGFDEDFGVDGNVNIPTFTANAIFKLPTGGFTPYLIGGAGLYRVGGELFGQTADAENRFGWNVGGGISMPLSGFKVFVEARFNQALEKDGNPSLNFIPIVFGASF
jgi:opacity protein-like surface antigen